MSRISIHAADESESGRDRTQHSTYEGELLPINWELLGYLGI